MVRSALKQLIIVIAVIFLGSIIYIWQFNLNSYRSKLTETFHSNAYITGDLTLQYSPLALVAHDVQGSYFTIKRVYAYIDFEKSLSTGHIQVKNIVPEGLATDFGIPLNQIHLTYDPRKAQWLVFGKVLDGELLQGSDGYRVIQLDLGKIPHQTWVTGHANVVYNRNENRLIVNGDGGYINGLNILALFDPTFSMQLFTPNTRIAYQQLYLNVQKENDKWAINNLQLTGAQYQINLDKPYMYRIGQQDDKIPLTLTVMQDITIQTKEGPKVIHHLQVPVFLSIKQQQLSLNRALLKPEYAPLFKND